MKPEQSERFLIEELFNKTQDKGIVNSEKLEEVDKLTGDASTRRYYRLFTDKHSYVVSLDNPFDDEAAKHPFYSIQNFLLANKVRVPRIIDHNLPKGYILQEDLGNETMIQHLSRLTTKEEEFS